MLPQRSQVPEADTNAEELRKDALARTDAIDIRQSVIVKAPAGSGKTELLVQRYLALLGQSCEHPKQLVAITFTRKAAAEMRRRLRLELLRKEPPSEDYKKSTYELAQKVRRKAENSGPEWHPHHLIDTETVTTIDGFCRTLMTLDADRAQFYDVPELITGHRIYGLYCEAAELAFDRLRKNNRHRPAMAELLYRHNNDVGLLTENFAGLLDKRGDLLPVMTVSNYNANEDLTALTDLLRERLEGCTPQEVFAADRWATLLPQEVARRFENMTNKTAERAGAKPGTPNVSDWQTLAEILLTKSGSLRKKPARDISNPIAKERAKEMLMELADADASEFIHQLGQSRGWAGGYDPAELSLADHSRLLFKEAVAELIVLFRTRGCCDYTEVLLAAQRVTGGEDAPTLLAERLGYQLRHLLVDEFQDTSSTQLRLLKNLSQSWDPSVNNTMFLVGDPMQSVYSFRNANVRIFNRLWQTGRLGQVKLKQIRLSCNYRSGASLVGWFNSNFAEVLSPAAAAADKNSLTDTVGYTPGLPAGSPDPDKDESCLPVFYVIGSSEERKPTATEKYAGLIEKLKTIRTSNPADTIAILGSKRAQLIPLLPFLQREGLDFQATEIFGVGDSMFVTDLMSLVRCLSGQSDDTAWYSLLRSPWCGLILADLNALAAEQHRSKADIPALLTRVAAKPTAIQGLSDDGISRLRLLERALAPGLRDTGRLQLSESTERAWHDLGGRMLLEDEQAEAELSVFLQILEANTVAGRVDLAAMSAQLKEEGLPLESGAQIQIMTVHKAKGLEFDHVFLPNTDKSSLAGNRGNDTIHVLSFSPSEKEKKPNSEPAGELAILALRFPTDSPESRPAHGMLERIRKEREEQEQRRLFYVACTRARKGLYMHYPAEARSYRGAFRSYIRAAGTIIKTEIAGHPGRKDAALAEQVRQGRQGPQAEETGSVRKLRRIALGLREAQINQQKRPELKALKGPAEPLQEVGQASQEHEQPRKVSIRHWQPPFERERGLLIHGLMEVLGNADRDLITDREKCKNLIRDEIARGLPRLLEAGLPPRLAEDLAGEARACIEKTLADKTGKWILGIPAAAGTPATEDAEVHTEWGILLPGGRGIRLDRSFIDNGTRWIVDYKTFAPEKPLTLEEAEREYGGQLVGYAKALNVRPVRQAEHNRVLPIKIGIYCPQNCAWFAWDYDVKSETIRRLPDSA